MEILENFVIPQVSRAGRAGSKYLPVDAIKAIKDLKVKAAMVLPPVEGATAAHQRKTVADRLKLEITGEELGNKVFNVYIVPEKGVAVYRAEDKAAEPAKEAK